MVNGKQRIPLGGLHRPGAQHWARDYFYPKVIGHGARTLSTVKGIPLLEHAHAHQPASPRGVHPRGCPDVPAAACGHSIDRFGPLDDLPPGGRGQISIARQVVESRHRLAPGRSGTVERSTSHSQSLTCLMAGGSAWWPPPLPRQPESPSSRIRPATGQPPHAPNARL